MNDEQLTQLMKDTSAINDARRDEHVRLALDSFAKPRTRRSSRTALWSIAAGVLLVVGAGIGVSLQSLTNDNPVIYANGDIETLGGVSLSADNTTAVVTKGAPPLIGPCDEQFSEERFVSIVSIGSQRVAVYALTTNSEPIVRLVDPKSCDELAIARR